MTTKLPTSGGASYVAKGLKPPPPDFAQAPPPRFLCKVMLCLSVIRGLTTNTVTLALTQYYVHTCDYDTE